MLAEQVAHTSREKSPERRENSPERRLAQVRSITYTPNHSSLHEEELSDLGTNAVNRSFGDLDAKKYLTYIGVLCAVRVAMQHPLTMALARKQTCSVASELSTSRIIADIYKKEGGFRALTSGMPVYVAGTALSEVISMGLYEYGRFSLPIESDARRDATSGYLGDVCSRWLYTPLICIANRQMTAESATSRRSRNTIFDNSLRGTCSRMYAEGGFRPFFAAFGTSIVVGSAWTGAWLSIYGQSKTVMYSGAERFAPTSFTTNTNIPLCARSLDDNFVINSTASVFTSAATAVMFNPFLVIRTRMQISTGSTLIGTMQHVLKENGARGFFKGTSLNVCACLLDGWLLSTTYEWAKLWSDKTKAA